MSATKTLPIVILITAESGTEATRALLDFLSASGIAFQAAPASEPGPVFNVFGTTPPLAGSEAPAENGSATFKVAEFCKRNGISLSCYYGMRKRKQGPREMRVGKGGGVRISPEAERDWRRARETPDASDQAMIAKLHERARKGGRPRKQDQSRSTRAKKVPTAHRPRAQAI